MKKKVEILFNGQFYERKEKNIVIIRKIYGNEYEDLFKKCFDSIDKVLKLAKLKKDDINEIILRIGSSKTPRIQVMKKKY